MADEGYTLVELVTALTLLLIVSSLSYSVYLKATEFKKKWEERFALANAALLVENALREDLRFSKTFDQANDSSWHIHADKKVVYKAERGDLYRQQRPIFSAEGELVITSFSIARLEGDSSLAKVSIELNSSKEGTPFSVYRRPSYHWIPFKQK